MSAQVMALPADNAMALEKEETVTRLARELGVPADTSAVQPCR